MIDHRLDPGNYAAIGTFQPEIEIWNLDLIDALYPRCSLGKTGKEEKQLKKPKKSPHRHVDAVLGLSWNKGCKSVSISFSFSFFFSFSFYDFLLTIDVC